MIEKRKVKPAKAKVGDVVAVRFTPSLSGYVQVLSTYPRNAGVIGVYSVAPGGAVNLDELSKVEFAEVFHVELTGVVWGHWITAGNLPVTLESEPNKTGGATPCQVATWNVLNALKQKGLVKPDFRTYTQIKAYHPKLHDYFIRWQTETMKYLEEKKLLTKEGVSEIRAGDVGSDFMLHSGLLSKEGNQFYDLVFLRDYAVDTQEDTHARLEEYWEKFKGSR